MIIKNSVWMSIAQIVSKGIKFILIIVATRILGPEQYGIFTYATYLVGFFFAFSELGLGILLMREYQKESWNKDVLLSAIFSIRAATSLVAFCAALILYFSLSDPAVKPVFLVLLFMFFTSTFRDLYISLARARNRMEYDSLASIGDSLITTIAGIALLLTTKSLMGFVAAYALGAAFSISFIIIATRSFRFNPAPFSFHDVLYLIRQGFPFFVATCSLFLLTQIDVIMLKHLKGYSDVGYYSVGLRIIQVISFIPGLLIMPIFPILAERAEQNKEIRSLAQTTFSLICMVSIPIALGGATLAHNIILSFFGSQYSAGTSSFGILILIIPFIFGVTLFDYILVSIKRQFLNTLFTFGAAFLNVLLNIVLIPHFSGSGAALASLLSQMVNITVSYVCTKRILGFSYIDWKALAVFTAASLLMSIILIILLVFLKMLPTLLLILTGTLVYFMILILLKERTLLTFLQRIKKHTI